MTVSLDSKALDDDIATMASVAKIAEGLCEFAGIRNDEDAGDWIVVVQVADLVRRVIEDVAANMRDAMGGNKEKEKA